MGVLEGERGDVSFPKRLVWNQLVSNKVGFFVLEAWWGKVMTLNQLKRTSFSLANRCCFC